MHVPVPGHYALHHVLELFALGGGHARRLVLHQFEDHLLCNLTGVIIQPRAVHEVAEGADLVVQFANRQLHSPGQRLVNRMARTALLVSGLHHGAQQAQLFDERALAIPSRVQAVMPCLTSAVQLHGPPSSRLRLAAIAMPRTMQ
ncbi:hypothetical protein D3C77_590530 [compost metagenome]